MADDVLSTSAAGPAAVRGGALRVGGFFLGSLVGLLSAALLFRHLGVKDTGRYVTAMSLVAIVAALSDLGLTSIGVRELSRSSVTERWSLARDLLGLRLTLTLAGTVLMIAIAWIAYSAALAAGVALACVGLALQATQDNLSLPLTIGLRLGWVSALDLARQLLTSIATIALVVAGATLVPFLGVSIPVGIVLLLFTWRLVRGVRALRPTFSAARWRRFTSAMLPYSAATAAAALYFRVSILLVSALSTATQLGYFSASFRSLEVLTLVPAMLVGSAFPILARAAHDDHERLGYALGRLFEVATIVGSWVAVSIAVGAPLAMKIIGGAKFAPAAPVLAFQGIGLGAMFVSLVWAYALLSLGLYRTIMVLSLSALALNAALVTPLTLLDGARGAALATGIAEIVVGVAQCLAVVRGRPSLSPSLAVLPRVILASVLGLAPLALTGAPVIARICISTFLFVSTLLITRAFPAELLDLLPPIARGPVARLQGHS
jgi:O-antigen/teichoic acid export membrane protein